MRRTFDFSLIGFYRNHNVIVFVRPIVDGVQTSV
jgi:hypothetical protein